MNRVVVVILCCILHKRFSYSHRESQLGIVEFVINNSPSQSIGYMPFFSQFWLSPSDPVGHPSGCRFYLCWNYIVVYWKDVANVFLSHILPLLSIGIAEIQPDQRRCEQPFHARDQVLLSIETLNLKNAPHSKLRKRFVGLFYVTRSVG